MTTLVTGAAGYIGSQIVHALTRMYDGEPVIGVDRLSTGYAAKLPRGVECFMGDVRHTKFIANLIERYKVRSIIHCAASVSAPSSVNAPLSYYDNNVSASRTLIETAMTWGVREFIFSSTAAVYGEPDLLANRPLREDDRTQPVSPYGWSKLMTEQMLRDAYVAHGVRYVALRFFNVAGADPLMQTGPGPGAPHLISAAVRAAVRGGAITVHGMGANVRDYVHVNDVATAHIAALNHLRHGRLPIVLNVGTGQGYTVREVIQAVRDISGIKFECDTGPGRPGDPMYTVADNRRIIRELGWQPAFTLDDMIRHALAWERAR